MVFIFIFFSSEITASHTARRCNYLYQLILIINGESGFA
ncbi:hypothetical protein EC253486_1849 [Escherichia coli 2534-86]|nr:hypothetical protein EC253486_1849 [Escherichia coli 2534-86]